MEIDWSAGITATSYGTGPFHPAIRNGKRVSYWPDTTFASEDEAYQCAVRILDGVLEDADAALMAWDTSEA